ncbi:MAG: M20 family metallopeptidase [Clostridia bacterium]|nr:M20 family metallopeptidase [Clostridia bacterium]
MTINWQEALRDVVPHVTALRRELHRHPELSGHEEKTRETLLEALRPLGCKLHEFKNCNGIMATVENGEGDCVAVRADMDALPVCEPAGLSFASANEGVMHACGHDVHMALAYGCCKWLCENRDKWQGTVKFLFEPMEETVGGGKLMVEQGCMENPDVKCVIGQHVNPRYKAGVFFAKPGFVSGSSDDLMITVKGSQCHGAYPEQGIDAIVLSAQIVSALQQLVSRTISPFDPAVVTIGTINGGKANNIVCGEVVMRGTLRTMSADTRKKLQAEIVSTAEGIASAMGGSARVDIIPSYGAVYNDDAFYSIIDREAETLLGRENMVLREAPSLGVESFCYFLDHTPGVYYDIGSGIGTALHTDTFMVDEDCLLPGVALQCASVLALLKA